MSGRDLNAGALAVLGDRLAAAMFVEMRLDTPLYFSNAGVNIEHGGRTWIGVEQLEVGSIQESSGEVQQMQFTLPAVPNEFLALALETAFRGKGVVLYLGIMHPETQAVLQLLQIWAGRLDTMPVRYGPETAGISVTAEHRGISFARPKPLRYTDADQRRLYAGDACLEYLIKQSQAQDVWPSAELFKQ